MKITRVQNKQVTLNDLAVKAISEADSAHVYVNPDKSISGQSYPLKDIRVKTRFGVKSAEYVYMAKAETLRIETALCSITCTLTHKMYTQNRDWVPAGQLTLEDLLEDENGNPVAILSLNLAGDQEVIDICVPGVHEYYGNGLVSHNSLISNQLCINQSRIGYKVTNVPLEMSVAETTSRILANVSDTDSISIFLKKLASGERDAVYRKYRQYNRRCLKNNGRYSIFKPRSDVSMEELINAIEDIKSDVIYVDYVSLLKDADGDEQWKKLGQIARFGKIHAESKNCIVVLLAQVDDDGRIRYSQAIKEHSSLAWVFNATKETRERGILSINMLKSRNQVMRPFTLKVNYATMRVTDPTPEETEKYGTPASSKPSAKKKAGASEYVPDLAE